MSNTVKRFSQEQINYINNRWVNHNSLSSQDLDGFFSKLSELTWKGVKDKDRVRILKMEYKIGLRNLESIFTNSKPFLKDCYQSVIKSYISNNSTLEGMISDVNKDKETWIELGVYEKAIGYLKTNYSHLK